MRELKLETLICMTMREGETEIEAKNRLETLLDSELCSLADHDISWQSFRYEVQEI